VRQALATLSPEHRAVLVLHELCDLSVEEIASQLRVPRGTVKSRLSRGRTALAGLLTEPAEPTDAVGASDRSPVSGPPAAPPRAVVVGEGVSDAERP
jgi:RNA polymerase sigma-70 factor (ECF subfamily)